jgi:hypothetical protein
LESELLDLISPLPTLVQKLLVRRAVLIQFQLVALDEKFENGTFTDHDRRMVGALNNAYRLILREISAASNKGDKRSRPSLVRALTEGDGT